jgi:hypothetical protein
MTGHEKVIRLSPKRRKVTLDVLALDLALKAGTLLDQDREAAEKMMPGICDLLTGKVKALRR